MTLSPTNPMRIVLMTTLVFEVLVFGLAIPVMILVSAVPATRAGVCCGGAALLALVAAGLIRKPVGYLIGWVTQVVAVALGVLTAPMYVVGGLFALLWVTSFVLGKRLDAAQQQRTA